MKSIINLLLFRYVVWLQFPKIEFIMCAHESHRYLPFGLFGESLPISTFKSSFLYNNILCKKGPSWCFEFEGLCLVIILSTNSKRETKREKHIPKCTIASIDGLDERASVGVVHQKRIITIYLSVLHEI